MTFLYIKTIFQSYLHCLNMVFDKYYVFLSFDHFNLFFFSNAQSLYRMNISNLYSSSPDHILFFHSSNKLLIYLFLCSLSSSLFLSPALSFSHSVSTFLSLCVLISMAIPFYFVIFSSFSPSFSISGSLFFFPALYSLPLSIFCFSFSLPRPRNSWISSHLRLEYL